MKAVFQRVLNAKVEVDGKTTGEIGQGALILLGVMEGDGKEQAEQIAQKIAYLRVFEDENGKMNRSVMDIGGRILLVSQFTLAADCSRGRRPSFVRAAAPEQANELYEYTASILEELLQKPVGKGIFGADMKVSLINDGPVTILLDTDDWKKE